MLPLQDEVRVNAYVDGELDVYERTALLEELARDPKRRNEAAEIGELKELVRAAFEHVPHVPNRPTRRSPQAVGMGLRFALGAVAALMLIGLAFGVGWSVRGGGARLDQQLAALGGVRLAAPAIRAPGVLLHLESFRGQDADTTLQRARALLKRYRGSGLQVEVIVNGMALEFLKTGYFPYSHEFAKLMRAYPNLEVVACGGTLEALHEQGQRLSLLKGVRIAPSAVQEVVKRLEEGWVYVNS